MEKIGLGIIGLIMIIGFVVMPIYAVNYVLTNSVETITIKEKYIKTEDKRGVFYIVLESGEVVQNKDSLYYWKFDSADMQVALKVGQTYRATLQGWRWPLFSCYRNIVAAEAVE